tara:strand:- start:723 stop:896 length:174 start_codon:yes stop_codon:yes gene_type:complete
MGIVRYSAVNAARVVRTWDVYGFAWDTKQIRNDRGDWNTEGVKAVVRNQSEYTRERI